MPNTPERDVVKEARELRWSDDVPPRLTTMPEQILSEEDLKEIEAHVTCSYIDRNALCNTVRALQEIERTALKRAEKYCDRPDDMPVSAIVNVAFNVLESRLSEVEKEREAEHEAHRVTIENLSETLAKYDALRHFRTRVINLCKEKAAEWELEAIAESERNPDLSRDSASRAIAVNELREAIENLDHKE